MDLGYEDIVQLYGKSVVMYKGKPVYIEAVGGNGAVLYHDLRTQRSHQTMFSLKDFKSPAKRLGFVNVKGSVIYAMRMPVRRFKVGLSRENTHFNYVPGAPYPVGEHETIEYVSRLRGVELADSLDGKYPTLKECTDHLREFKGAMAFDRQFAVDDRGSIFYRTTKVGKLAKRADGQYTAADIEFNDKHKHLIILLEGNHEKDLSALG